MASVFSTSVSHLRFGAPLLGFPEASSELEAASSRSGWCTIIVGCFVTRTPFHSHCGASAVTTISSEKAARYSDSSFSMPWSRVNLYHIDIKPPLIYRLIISSTALQLEHHCRPAELRDRRQLGPVLELAQDHDDDARDVGAVEAVDVERQILLLHQQLDDLRRCGGRHRHVVGRELLGVEVVERDVFIGAEARQVARGRLRNDRHHGLEPQAAQEAEVLERRVRPAVQPLLHGAEAEGRDERQRRRVHAALMDGTGFRVHLMRDHLDTDGTARYKGKSTRPLSILRQERERERVD
ncbi:unnamed protein product [Phytophthora fragariaefolia]|uniref:Unnamed protein product n=1 Tax=Phytophthora fragariaefolia TaxID=1490495 RepID=A0A9W6Y537_9STRA|nr:unnamed protein product [Phytophthora fragariaefolia]